MKLRPWHRHALAAMAAALAFLAAVHDAEQAEPGQAHAGAPRVEASASPAPPALRIELERLGRRDGAEADPEVGSAFAAVSWFVPPPPPPPPPPRKPAPPPPPSAPPLPFSFLGRYVEDGVLVILLVRGDRIYTVSEGEVIDNTYRVERLTRGGLELTYLPLDIRQTLSTGES